MMTSQYRAELGVIARGKGESVVRAVAYQSANRYTDVRLGEVHDFRRKAGVVSTGLFLPGGRRVKSEKFWNDVELHHKKARAVTGRDAKLIFPKELSSGGRIALTIRMAKFLVLTFGVAVETAVHAPRYFTSEALERAPMQYWELDEWGRPNNGNWHLHCAMSACFVEPTKDGYRLGKKCIALDPISCSRVGMANPAKLIRLAWCQFVNEALQGEGISLQVDHRSYKERGIEQVPGCHLGAASSAIERRTGECSAKRRADEERMRKEKLKRQQQRMELEDAQLAASLQVKLEKSAEEIQQFDLALAYHKAFQITFPLVLDNALDEKAVRAEPSALKAIEDLPIEAISFKRECAAERLLDEPRVTAAPWVEEDGEEENEPSYEYERCG